MYNNKIYSVECPEAMHMYIVSCQGLTSAGSTVWAGLSLRLLVTGYNHAIISKWGIEQIGISCCSIFLLFSMRISGRVTLNIVALGNPRSLSLSICSECKATCSWLILLHQSAWFMFCAHGKRTSFLEEHYAFSCWQDSLAALGTCKSTVLLTQKCWVITKWENTTLAYCFL